MTLADLCRKVLEELAVTAAGDPADASDIAVIASKYASVYDQLAGLKLVRWAQNGEIPSFAVEPLIWMCAFAAGPSFGKAVDGLKGAIGLSPPALGERQLRQQVARGYVSTPAESEYF